MHFLLRMLYYRSTLARRGFFLPVGFCQMLIFNALHYGCIRVTLARSLPWASPPSALLGGVERLGPETGAEDSHGGSPGLGLRLPWIGVCLGSG